MPLRRAATHSLSQRDVACLAWYLGGAPLGFREDGMLSCPHACLPGVSLVVQVAGWPSCALHDGGLVLLLDRACAGFWTSFLEAGALRQFELQVEGSVNFTHSLHMVYTWASK